MKVRNVNLGRNYELEDDLFVGLKNAVDTTRPALALEYVNAILQSFSERLDELENPTKVESEVLETKKTTTKTPAKETKTEINAESDTSL